MLARRRICGVEAVVGVDGHEMSETEEEPRDEVVEEGKGITLISLLLRWIRFLLFDLLNVGVNAEEVT